MAVAGRGERVSRRSSRSRRHFGPRKVVALALAGVFIAASTAAQERPPEPCNRANGIHPGHKRRIVVSIPDRKLALVENGRAVLTFAISVGAASSPSPSGEFRVANLVIDPTYYHPGEVIPPGPDNPVGPRWIGLSIKGYGIHGTNEPRLIGRRASHGCIRLRNRDVKTLFAHVRVGDPVELHAQRNDETAQLFGGQAAPVLLASGTETNPAAAAEIGAR